MPFQKGRKKTGGRKPGSINKFTTVKETVFSVFNQLQDDKEANLLAFAKKYPKDFYFIASKLIPTEITGKDGKDLFIPITEIEVVHTNEIPLNGNGTTDSHPEVN